MTDLESRMGPFESCQEGFEGSPNNSEHLCILSIVHTFGSIGHVQT